MAEKATNTRAELVKELKGITSCGCENIELNVVSFWANKEDCMEEKSIKVGRVDLSTFTTERAENLRLRLENEGLFLQIDREGIVRVDGVGTETELLHQALYHCLLAFLSK